MPKRVVILGAGLAGLSAGWVLANSGYQVTLLEKTAAAGGLAVTKRRGAYEYDLGPHNIHTVHAHIIDFFKRHFPTSFFEHAPKSKILKQGKYVDYPLKGFKVIASLPAWKLPSAGASFFLARVRMFMRKPETDDSFQAWITNRFGPILFQEYFGPYASKVWGVAPDKIDRYVAEKRIPVIHLTELIRAALLGVAAGANHPEFQAHNYYLRHGIGETVDFFRKGCESAGVEIAYNASPTCIHTESDRATGVTYSNADGSSTKLTADYVLSTIPLNDAVALFDEAPGQVRELAAGLDYCATVLVFLEIGRTEVLPESMLYLSDPAVRFSRVSDVGMYSRAMVPPGKTLLCIEFPCSIGDATWKEADESLAEHAISVLTACGALTPSDVEGRFCERISHSYPRFRVGFEQRLKACSSFFATLKNFISYGRQGSFSYHNVDNVIHAGFRASAAIMGAESMGYGCYEWFSAR